MTSGNKVPALVKGAEMAKAAAGNLPLAKVLGAEDAPAEETLGEKQQGETTGPELGAATEGIAETSAEGVEMAAAVEGEAAAAEGEAAAPKENLFTKVVMTNITLNLARNLKW